MADPERLIAAMLSNLDGWIEELAELEPRVIPGNKAAVLHLLKNMQQAKISLERLARED